MPLIARLVLLWFAASVVISPFVGMVLSGGRRQASRPALDATPVLQSQHAAA